MKCERVCIFGYQTICDTHASCSSAYELWINIENEAHLSAGRHLNNSPMLEHTYECGIDNVLCASVLRARVYKDIARV